MVALVTLEQANAHLRLDLDLNSGGSGDANDDNVADCLLKMEQATEIVLDYIKQPSNSDGWDEDNVPKPIQTAILLVLGSLWENREGDKVDSNPLSDAVKSLLHRSRDPALA